MIPILLLWIVTFERKQMKTKTKLSVKDTEKILNLPVESWKGKCHWIATRLVEFDAIRGRAVYGHWIGQISPKSFYKARRHMPFVQHGWIIAEDNTIVDPTRWVFEAIEPYIYYGGDAEDDIELFDYDEGGNKWREAIIKPVPKFNKKERIYSVVLSDDAQGFLSELLSQHNWFDTVSHDQMFWLANLPLNFFGPYVKEIYQWIVGVGLVALIPIDNKIKILGR